jgi:hypothetical protein
MQTIFLEFKREAGNLAANGTDVTFYLDGRWGAARQRTEIWNRISDLRRRANSPYRNQLFVGYTFAGGRSACIYSMKDPDPPAWAMERECTCATRPGWPDQCPRHAGYVEPKKVTR